MMRLTGSWVALVMPLTDAGAVDIAGFQRLIDFDVALGITGLLICGSTGEPSLLTTDEKCTLFDQVLPYAQG